MIKEQLIPIYKECVSLPAGKLQELKNKYLYDVVQQTGRTDKWQKELNETELIYVTFAVLERQFGNLEDKEIHSIIEALELTGYPRSSFERIAIGDSHFVGEILEFITASPFVVYQQKRLADLMERNNSLLEQILDTLIMDKKVGIKSKDPNHLPMEEMEKRINEIQKREGLSDTANEIQKKINEIKDKANIQSGDKPISS